MPFIFPISFFISFNKIICFASIKKSCINYVAKRGLGNTFGIIKMSSNDDE